MNQVTINNEQEMDLNERLLKALAKSTEANKAVIEVINENGMITLMGEVDTPEQRRAIEHLVANEPGVISVINNIKIVIDR